MIELFFANDRNQITFPDIVALCSKAKKNVLIDHRTVLAEVEFFHSIDLRVVDEERIAGSQNRAQIRFRDFDTHLFVAPHENVARFSGSVFHYCRVLDVFNVGRQRAKILRGLVHHAQDAFDGPICGSLRGQRSKPA